MCKGVTRATQENLISKVQCVLAVSFRHGLLKSGTKTIDPSCITTPVKIIFEGVKTVHSHLSLEILMHFWL